MPPPANCVKQTSLQSNANHIFSSGWEDKRVIKTEGIQLHRQLLSAKPRSQGSWPSRDHRPSQPARCLTSPANGASTVATTFRENMQAWPLSAVHSPHTPSIFYSLYLGVVEHTSFPPFCNTLSIPFELADIISAPLLPVAAHSLLCKKKSTFCYPI